MTDRYAVIIDIVGGVVHYNNNNNNIIMYVLNYIVPIIHAVRAS